MWVWDLDDSVIGDKYMGMFAENELAGAGTCIRMNGDYFEGIYLNDKICGEGVPVFENGDYYEGELNLDGPNGKGCYYLPQSEIIEDDFEPNSPFLLGNIFSGNLAGDWNDIKVTQLVNVVKVWQLPCNLPQTKLYQEV